MTERLIAYTIQAGIGILSLMVAYLVVCLWLGAVGWVQRKMGVKPRRALNLPRHR